MKIIKEILKYIIIYIGVFLILFIALILTAKIPRKSIENKLDETINFFVENKGIDRKIKDREYTYIHYYADSVLLNIIYNIDSEHPIKSVILDEFYKRMNFDVNYDFLETVTKNSEANTQYLRYWHGSIIILRPLLTMFSIGQIYTINKVVIWILAISLLILILKKSKKLAIIYVISMVMIVFPIVPFCFEYTWMFYLMLISSIIAISIEKKGNNKLYVLFFITGMLTAFFDFLSTELITILVPILLVTFIRKEENRLEGPKETFIFAIKSMLLWGIAYCMMWFTKWGLASILLKTNAINEYVLEDMLNRINGLQGVPTYKELYLKALYNNLHTLYPINLVTDAVMVKNIGVGFLIIFALLIDWKNIRKKWYSGLVLIIGIIPYIRYLVLANHSYRHYFFTFRSQIVTIIAIGIILIDCFNKKLWLKKIGKNKKKNIEKEN